MWARLITSGIVARDSNNEVISHGENEGEEEETT
jgi:hypothetical protein